MHESEIPTAATPKRIPWNKDKLIGPRPPLQQKHVWAIRTRLQIERRVRELALFNLAIDSKLRGCDLVAIRVDDVARNGYAIERTSVRQRKTGRPVRFSFMDTRIQAIGIAQSYCWESPKPLEFGSAGQNWEDIGWKVKVAFTGLNQKIRPKDHIGVLRPLRPERYSPLQPNGNGLQSVYLTEVPATMAEVLMGLIGEEVKPLSVAAQTVKPVAADDLDVWEGKLEQQVASDTTVPETERRALIRARKGQGLFKERVSQIETKCRITGVQNPVHLIASHCKPWRDSSNEERLNAENGLS
jgi:hypothetical protein